MLVQDTIAMAVTGDWGDTVVARLLLLCFAALHIRPDVLPSAAARFSVVRSTCQGFIIEIRIISRTSMPLPLSPAPQNKTVLVLGNTISCWIIPKARVQYQVERRIGRCSEINSHKSVFV